MKRAKLFAEDSQQEPSSELQFDGTPRGAGALSPGALSPEEGPAEQRSQHVRAKRQRRHPLQVSTLQRLTWASLLGVVVSVGSRPVESRGFRSMQSPQFNESRTLGPSRWMSCQTTSRSRCSASLAGKPECLRRSHVATLHSTAWPDGVRAPSRKAAHT
jgi:hypothetical protein